MAAQNPTRKMSAAALAVALHTCSKTVNKREKKKNRNGKQKEMYINTGGNAVMRWK